MPARQRIWKMLGHRRRTFSQRNSCQGNGTSISSLWAVKALSAAGDALTDHGIHAVRHVILHEPAPLPLARTAEGLAETSGAAKLGLQDGIAADREELRQPVKAGAVVIRGAPVRQHYHRQIFRRCPGGKRQIGGYRGTVARRIRDAAGGPERHLAECRILLTDDIGAVSIEIDQIVDRRMGSILDLGHHAAAVPGVTVHSDGPSGKGTRYGFESHLRRVVEPVSLRIFPAQLELHGGARKAVRHDIHHIRIDSR
ncbi:MAG TPA: hypothetical protein VGG96_08405 [Steroidobacteraceae bacterium]|jgi:hypothetical protein